MKKVLAISGSLRENSTSLKVINTISNFKLFEIEVFDGLDKLPHFNPDKNNNAPKQILNFRQKIKESDGVIICSPEYVFAIPGSLKNAIDWTVSSGEFIDKAVSIIVASTSGVKAFESLQLVLKTLMARIDNTCLLMSGVRSKFQENGTITDSMLLEDLMNTATFLNHAMNEKDVQTLNS